jgi:signal transduction histidine kinase
MMSSMQVQSREAKPRRPWVRADEHRVVAGVAAGIAARTGIDVRFVRAAFVLAALASGSGIAAYVLAWLFLPASRGRGNIISKALNDRQGITFAAGLVTLLVALLVVASFLGAGWLGSLAWPLVISAAGLVLLWRNAPPDEQETLRRLVDPLLGFAGQTTPARTALRVSVATVLLAAGLAALLAGHARSAVLQLLVGVALVIAAIVVVMGPWWLRITRDLITERQARIRAEERADMASRVHDSVLQTLALIQRHAGEPQQVIRLARAQERELRSWLFDGRPPGSLDDTCTTVVAGVRLIQREVEAQHGISVEVVTVGDCELDEGLNALLAAGREATVNAAKWSGVEIVSLFAEVEPSRVSLFVRDRGRGFDAEEVPGDRKGLAESIHTRMTRRGGSATVLSVRGEGTEVHLTMPRAAGVSRPVPA